jgi:hypothetical protein
MAGACSMSGEKEECMYVTGWKARGKKTTRKIKT